MFGLLSGIIDAGVKTAGLKQEREIADRNYVMQMDNLEYQKKLQQEIFAREDNAVQRRAEDLEKAGLSKTLAAGNAASAGQAISTNAPQKDSSFAKSMQNINIASSLVSQVQQFNRANEELASLKQSNINASVQQGILNENLAQARLDTMMKARDYGIIMGMPNVLSTNASNPLYQGFSQFLKLFDVTESNPNGLPFKPFTYDKSTGKITINTGRDKTPEGAGNVLGGSVKKSYTVFGDALNDVSSELEQIINNDADLRYYAKTHQSKRYNDRLHELKELYGE